MSDTDAQRTSLPRREVRIVLAITVLAGLLRFGTLDVQSFWGDEVATILLLKQSLPDLFSNLPDNESAPPLYYVLGWLWTHVFGTGTVGARSLSALIGTATVPVAWLAARSATPRAGLWAAAITACSPLTFYYAQEARTYALLILLAGLGFIAFQRALEQPDRRRLGVWAAISCAALLTHYFAAFVIAGQLFWFVRTLGLRPAIVASLPIGAVGLLLAPLAAAQRADGKSGWIEDTSLASRLAQAPKQFLVGIDAPAELVLAGLAGLLAAAAVGLVVARGTAAERRVATLAGSVAGISFLFPLLLSVSGAIDLFNGRNVVAAWVLVGVLVAVGLGSTGAPRAGTALGAALCAVMLATIVGVLTQPEYQRDDLRSIGRDLRGPAATAVVAGPVNVDLGTELYVPDSRKTAASQVRTASLAVVNLAERRTNGPPLPVVLPQRPPAGFTLERTVRGDGYAIGVYRAPRPTTVDLRALRAFLGTDAFVRTRPN